MNKFLFTFLFLLFAISLQSCSSCNHKKKNHDTDIVFEKGKVISDVKCKNDFTQSYSLYIPSNYSEDKKCPIVYAFDAHGKGLIPVELFKENAEKYGYIIIGSNNSKNGTPWNITSEIYDTLYSDTHQRFSIDNTRIYTAGFSGGSRVASSIALIKGSITGVIGCGAGFPSLDQAPAQKFAFFGIAGKEDFNLNELTSLDSSLEISGFSHYLEVFDGKHEWPFKAIVNDAFLWLELNAMKDKLKPMNNVLINNSFKEFNKNADTLLSKGNIYDAFLYKKKTMNYFDGLIDISLVKSGVLELSKNAVVLQKQKYLAALLTKEAVFQSNFTNAISLQSIDWWRAQVTALNQKINTSSDIDEKYMYKRLLNYLSLVAYMNASGTYKAEKFDLAEKYNLIYALVDPENPEHAYISASLFMKKNKQKEALISLEKSANLGFEDIARLETDTVFQSIKQMPEYLKIVEKMNLNKTKIK